MQLQYTRRNCTIKFTLLSERSFVIQKFDYINLVQAFSLMFCFHLRLLTSGNTNDYTNKQGRTIKSILSSVITVIKILMYNI